MWLVVGGALVLLGLATRRSSASGNGSAAGLPSLALPFMRYYSASWQQFHIPVPVLVAWTQRESGFKPREYNSESDSVMLAWSCEIASKDKWRVNPDFSKVTRVCQLCQEGKFDEARPLWTFGSAGLLQVAGIPARESGGYPYGAPNSGLFDPETNIRVGSMVIAKRRERLYPGRLDLTDEEWARVRAAYVGGPGIFATKPEKAAKIAALFLETLRSYR